MIMKKKWVRWALTYEWSESLRWSTRVDFSILFSPLSWGDKTRLGEMAGLAFIFLKTGLGYRGRDNFRKFGLAKWMSGGVVTNIHEFWWWSCQLFWNWITTTHKHGGRKNEEKSKSVRTSLSISNNSSKTNFNVTKEIF